MLRVYIEQLCSAAFPRLCSPPLPPAPCTTVLPLQDWKNHPEPVPSSLSGFNGGVNFKGIIKVGERTQLLRQQLDLLGVLGICSEHSLVKRGAEHPQS